MTDLTQAWFDLSGKTAVVTGASCNLGLKAARALGGAGARLMLCADEPDALERAVADLQSAGMYARWMAADAGQAAGRAQLVSETLHRMGDIDILVNHAAHPQRQLGGPVAGNVRDAGHSALEHNLRGFWELSQLVVQHSMMARRQGRIIHITPLAGLDDQPPAWGALLHQAAHSAVAHLTRDQAVQWGPHLITVNAIGLAHERADCNERDVSLDGFQGACLLFASEAGRNLSGQYLTASAVHRAAFDVA